MKSGKDMPDVQREFKAILEAIVVVYAFVVPPHNAARAKVGKDMLQMRCLEPKFVARGIGGDGGGRRGARQDVRCLGGAGVVFPWESEEEVLVEISQTLERMSG